MSRTISELTCWAQRRLKDAGIAEARLEARLLVSHLLHTDVGGLIAREQDRAPAGFATRLHPLLKRREAREPLAHILGETEFYGLPIKTDNRALVPRSDSEVVVELALGCLPRDAVSVADLGTGTGCLLLALLHQRPKLRGIGLDLEDGAVSLATENAALLGLSDRLEILQLDWNAWTGWGEADLIMSNPPYIRTDVIETLAPEVKTHDPRGALDGGADGLDAYREIVSLGAQKMKPGAWLVLEIGFDQRLTVSDLLSEHGFVSLEHRKDLGGNDRAIAARRPE